MFPSLLTDSQVDPFGAVSATALADDLRLLMRGRGAQPGQDMAKVGPALRTVCGISSSDSATEAIDATAAWLRSRISTLGSDRQRLCALAAFGLDEAARFPKTPARLAAAARRLGRSVATARRYAMAAITTIARTTVPDQTVPRQLRAHAGGWIELGIAADDGPTVVTSRCFLDAAGRHVDQVDKVYAIVHFGTFGTHRAVLAAHLLRIGLATSLSRSHLARILKDGGVSWQTTTTWKSSNDPDFVAKVHVLALYDSCPEGGRVICVDVFVRHEALGDRAEVKGLRRWAVAAAWLELRAA